MLFRDRFSIGLFIGPALLMGTALTINFVRWQGLLKNGGVLIGFRSAVQFGCLGYASAFFSIGTLGGDVLKATLLAKKLGGQTKPVFFATAMDRLVGLYSLCILVVIWFTSKQFDFSGGLHSELVLFGWLAIVGVVIGSPIVFICRVRALALSLLSQSLIVACVYWIAIGVHRTEALPSILDHFILVPMALLVAAVPISPGGIGVFEVTLDWMYALAVTATLAPSGILVGLAFSFLKLLLAAIAIALYFVLDSSSAFAGGTIRTNSACENQYFET
jgi:hypothetical protein